MLYGASKESVQGPLMFALFFASLEDVIITYGTEFML